MQRSMGALRAGVPVGSVEAFGARWPCRSAQWRSSKGTPPPAGASPASNRTLEKSVLGLFQPRSAEVNSARLPESFGVFSSLLKVPTLYAWVRHRAGQTFWGPYAQTRQTPRPAIVLDSVAPVTPPCPLQLVRSVSRFGTARVAYAFYSASH